MSRTLSAALARATRTASSLPLGEEPVSSMDLSTCSDMARSRDQGRPASRRAGAASIPPFNRPARSPALGVAAVQAGRAAIHDHHGLGAALVAHGRRGREAGALAGDRDALAVAFVVARGGCRGYFSVFF